MRLIRAYTDAFRGLPRDLWLLSVVALVNRSGTMVLPFLALYLTGQRGLAVTEAGRLLGLYGLGSILGSYLGGLATDRFGSLRTQHVSLLGAGVGLLWLGEARSMPAIATAVFLLSVVSDAYRPAVMAEMGHRASPELQMRAFALLRLAANLGMGIGPAAGGLLALYGYRWLFLANAAACWAALALSLLWLGTGARAPSHEGHEGPKRGPSPWKDGPFLLLMLLVVSLAFVFFQTMSTLPLYFRQSYGFREDAIGALLAFNPLLIVAFEMALIHWADRRPAMPLIGVGCFLTCAGFALMPLGRSVGFVLFTILVWTVGEMLALPLTNVVVARRAERRNLGRYMGIYTMAFSVAFVFAPAIGTWVLEHHGANALWLGIGAFGFALWFGALALRPLFRSGPVAG